MSTAVADPTAPSTPGVPVDLAAAFYGSPSKVEEVTSVEGELASTPQADTGSAASPQETAAPVAEVKPEPPKEAEAEKAKREESHRQAASRLGKQVQELEAKLDKMAEENKVLMAKLDGTYVEPQGPTPEQIRARAEFEGRELASRELANQRYGEDVVQERVYAKDSEFNQLRQAQPWIDHRIAMSHQPTLEALRILEENSFRGKYGNDPSQWAAKIIEEAKPAIVEEVRKTLKAPVVGTAAPTVTQARGSGGPTKRDRSLVDVFYGGTSAAS